MFKIRTRRGKLRTSITEELKKESPSLELILSFIDEYEAANLETIRKLKRDKEVTTKKLNGALRQTINAHGPITMQLIGSATKRIWGTLLVPKKETVLDKIKKLFNV